MLRHLLIPICLLSGPLLAEDMDHVFVSGDVEILHPWAVPMDGGLQIYMEIENGGTSVVHLEGGTSVTAQPTVLMATALDTSGAAETIGEIPVAAQSEMDLSPGGLYLWLEDAPSLQIGDHLEATITVRPVGEIDIEIEIFATGTRSHPHAGHHH